MWHAGDRLPAKTAEIKHCQRARACYFATPFRPATAGALRRTAFKCCIRMDAAGHNNIKLNPVISAGWFLQARIKIKKKIKIKRTRDFLNLDHNLARNPSAKTS